MEILEKMVDELEKEALRYLERSYIRASAEFERRLDDAIKGLQVVIPESTVDFAARGGKIVVREFKHVAGSQSDRLEWRINWQSDFATDLIQFKPNQDLRVIILVEPIEGAKQ